MCENPAGTNNAAGTNPDKKIKEMYRRFLFQECIQYKNLGYRILNDGAELFGNDTKIAPQAWLHQIYPPLNNDDINNLEQLVEIAFPNSLVDFYHEMNGFSIFSKKFSINGLRKNFSRNIEAAWQPFSIETKNIKEKPFNAKKEDIFIGFYSESGNVAYMDSKTEKISICASNNATSLRLWNNLYEFLNDEITNLFSKNALYYLQ